MSAADTPVLAALDLGDEQLDLMRDLMLHDVDQEDAALIAFGHPPRTTAPFHVQRIWCRLEARRIGNAARADLGMDPLPAGIGVAVPPATVPEALSRAFRVFGRRVAHLVNVAGSTAVAFHKVLTAAAAAQAGEIS